MDKLLFFYELDKCLNNLSLPWKVRLDKEEVDEADVDHHRQDHQEPHVCAVVYNR